jgi:hypothetical protein
MEGEFKGSKVQEFKASRVKFNASVLTLELLNP